jgi:hemoglobin-like flavoprotein
MALQGELLESSFQVVVLHGKAFAVAFYERLFTRFPQTRAFFADIDMSEQRKKLQQTLALLIQHMQNPEVLSKMLREMVPDSAVWHRPVRYAHWNLLFFGAFRYASKWKSP